LKRSLINCIFIEERQAIISFKVTPASLSLSISDLETVFSLSSAPCGFSHLLTQAFACAFSTQSTCKSLSSQKYVLSAVDFGTFTCHEFGLVLCSYSRYLSWRMLTTSSISYLITRLAVLFYLGARTGCSGLRYRSGLIHKPFGIRACLNRSGAYV
jgi:hypothetical protein